MKSRSNRLSRHWVARFLAAVLITIFSPNVLTPSFGVTVTAQDGSVSQSVSEFLFDGGRRQYYYEVYTFSDLFTLVDRVYMQSAKADAVVEIIPISASVDLSCSLEKELGRCVGIAQNRMLEVHSAYVSAINACVGRTGSGVYSCVLTAAEVFAESSIGCGCTLVPDHD